MAFSAKFPSLTAAKQQQQSLDLGEHRWSHLHA